MTDKRNIYYQTEYELRQFIEKLMTPALRKSCVNCEFFDLGYEVCEKANKRPPATVIAVGCELHVDITEIPF